MTALRERIADQNRYDDWRKQERVRDLDRQEDQAKQFERDILKLRGQIEAWMGRPDQLQDERDWQDVLDLLKDAAVTAESIARHCKAVACDVASGAAAE